MDDTHLGHMILDCFRKRPDAICQIDAATGASETNASVLSRSVELANCFRSIGLAPGDVVALSGKNHLDLHIPYYAAMFNGLPLAGVDPMFKYDEIKSMVKMTEPKIAFCEPEDYENYVCAAKELGLEVKIVTFGEGEHSMTSFIRLHQTGEKEDDFEPAIFDTAKTYVGLISTSGTSGAPKVVAFTYDTYRGKAMAYTRTIKPGDLSNENRLALNLSPVHWISGMFNPVGMPLLGQTLVQTSAKPTLDHVIDIINNYKPEQALFNPATLSYIFQHPKKCNMTCFKSIIITGAKVSAYLMTELKSRMQPGARAVEMAGQTETLGPILMPNAQTPPNSCGSPTPLYQIQLTDPDTGIVINEPYVTGEAQIKGLIFSEYYNCPEDTKNAFTEDGWFKTGDLFYRDENDNYFYVERLRTLIKYQGYQVLPSELEQVIRGHPGVYDVVVTGVPHAADGDWPVACVVRREGATVTADDVKEIVANNLSEKKNLKAVLFLRELPVTSTGKTALAKVKEIATKHLKDDCLDVLLF